MRFYWAWVAWVIWFLTFESVGLYKEVIEHKGDNWTLTHFLAVNTPLGMRVAFIAWVAYHFLIEHHTG